MTNDQLDIIATTFAYNVIKALQESGENVEQGSDLWGRIAAAHKQWYIRALNDVNREVVRSTSPLKAEEFSRQFGKVRTQVYTLTHKIDRIK